MKQRKTWEPPVILDVRDLPDAQGLSACNAGSTANPGPGLGRGQCATGPLAHATCLTGGLVI